MTFSKKELVKGLRYSKKKIPDRVYIKDNEDLKRKLKERVKKLDTGKTKMLTVDEAFDEIM